MIDPLVSAETAAAALALYREHRGERPVTGLIYTHSHVDHFGGAKGVVSAEEVEAGGSPSSPPPASSTTRSARTSSPAPRWAAAPATCTGRCSSAGPTGQIGSGLGQTTSLGTITLIPPNARRSPRPARRRSSTACG